MLPFWRSEPETPRRIEIEVQVETRVDVDYDWLGEQEDEQEDDGEGEGEGEAGEEAENPCLAHNSHDSAQSPTTTPPFVRRAVTAVSPDDTTYKPSSSLRRPYLENGMMFSSNSDYDVRVCLNPCPNFTLGKHRRTIGVYLAGALVCLLFFFSCQESITPITLTRLFCVFSLRWRIGPSWMPLCCHRMQGSNGTTNHLSMLLSSIGCRGSAPYWVLS